jgi:hypothetical protein
MSESAGTPRTDAAYEAYLAEGPTTGFSPVALCRTLERELADCRAELEVAKKAAYSAYTQEWTKYAVVGKGDLKFTTAVEITAPSPAGPDALAEEQVREAAKVLAISPLIESPKGLAADSWMGLARHMLTAALRSRPAQGDCGHTFDGKAIRPCPICDAAMSQQEGK